MKLIVSDDEIINGGLWQLFPPIEVSKTKDIPCDYPGAMGVPITALDKIGKNDGHSGVEIIDSIKPKINGKQKYQRLIIRNLKPKIPKEIDLITFLEYCGLRLDIYLEVSK